MSGIGDLACHIRRKNRCEIIAGADNSSVFCRPVRKNIPVICRRLRAGCLSALGKVYCFRIRGDTSALAGCIDHRNQTVLRRCIAGNLIRKCGRLYFRICKLCVFRRHALCGCRLHVCCRCYRRICWRRINGSLHYFRSRCGFFRRFLRRFHSRSCRQLFRSRFYNRSLLLYRFRCRRFLRNRLPVALFLHLLFLHAVFCCQYGSLRNDTRKAGQDKRSRNQNCRQTFSLLIHMFPPCSYNYIHRTIRR